MLVSSRATGSASVTDELDRLLGAVKQLDPAELRKVLADHLKTHCKHGTLRTEHCPWCAIDTPAYRQALADAMRTVLD